MGDGERWLWQKRGAQGIIVPELSYANSGSNLHILKLHITKYTHIQHVMLVSSEEDGQILFMSFVMDIGSGIPL